jgi:hypothetical protein
MHILVCTPGDCDSGFRECAREFAIKADFRVLTLDAVHGNMW